MGRDEEGERPVTGPPLAARWEAIARIAAGLSHDVRNPLNALAIHLEVLADKLRRDGQGALPAHLEKNLLAARAQVGRVDGIVRRFAEFAGARDFGRDGVAARALLEDVAGLCHHEAGRHGVALAVEAEEDMEVRASGPALAQVLVGLVIGLLDAGLEGGRLVLSARARAEWVEFRLAVESGSIAPAVARAVVEGSGEGRGAVEAIVGAAGGEVAIETNDGAAVVLRLPRGRRERSGAVL
jgi:two-component system sensor histidine kinase HydH